MPVLLRPRTLPELWDLAVGMVRQGFLGLLPFLLGSVLLVLPRDIYWSSLPVLGPKPPLAWTAWGLAVATKSLLLAVLTFHLHAVYRGEAISPLPLLYKAASRWAGFLVLSVVLYVAIMVGLCLLVVPGLALLRRYGLAPTILLLENRSVVDALRRSATLSATEPRRLLEAYLITYGCYGLLLVAILFFAPRWLPVGGARALRLLFSLIAIPILVAFRVSLYYDIRVRGEGLDLETLLAPSGQHGIASV